MISDTQNFVNITLAAAISTTLFAFGLRSVPSKSAGGKRVRRWPSIIGGVVGLLMTMFTALGTRMSLGDRGSLLASLVVLALALVAGLYLLRVGLRGRRVGEHPYCRQCGFDLFGRPEGSDVCNECGSDLAAPRAILIGEKQRRMLPLVIGMFVMIVVLALCAPLTRDGYAWAKDYDWSRWKSASRLLADAKNNPTDWRPNNELHRRLINRSLDTASIQAWIEAANQSPSYKRGPAYLTPLAMTGYVAEQAWAQGRFDESQVRPYLREALALQLNVAPQAARDRVLRFWVISPDLRLGRQTRHYKENVSFASQKRQLFVNGIEVKDAAIDDSPFTFEAAEIALKSIGTRARLDELGLKPGPANVELRLSASVTLAVEGKPTLVESQDLVLTGTTTIVEPGVMVCPPVTAGPSHPQLPIDDPINVEAMKRQVDVEADAVSAQASIDENGKPILRVRYITVANGAGGGGAILGEASLRLGDEEKPLGPVYLAQWDEATLPLDAPLSQDAQLIIRATPERGDELFRVVPSYRNTITVNVAK